MFYPYGDESRRQVMRESTIEAEVIRKGVKWVLLAEPRVENIDQEVVHRNGVEVLLNCAESWSRDEGKIAVLAYDDLLETRRRVGLHGGGVAPQVEVDLLAEGGGMCKKSGRKIERNLLGSLYSDAVCVSADISREVHEKM